MKTVDIIAKLLVDFAAGMGIAYLAFRARALDIGGAMAAAVLGMVVFGLGGLGWAAVLLTFFISASALSKLYQKAKPSVGQNFAKGSRRDAGQAAANGGVSLVGTLAALVGSALVGAASGHHQGGAAGEFCGFLSGGDRPGLVYLPGLREGDRTSSKAQLRDGNRF